MNGKVYIGQTIQPQKRWYAHRQSAASARHPLARAIQKYGAAGFEFIVLAVSKTSADADATEAALIEQYSSMAHLGRGYNRALGGMTAPKTKEWRDQVSAAQKGRPLSEAHKAALRKPKSVTTGMGRKPGSIPWNKGAHGMQVAWNKGITGSDSHSFGRVFSEERRRNVADGKRRGWSAKKSGTP